MCKFSSLARLFCGTMGWFLNFLKKQFTFVNFSSHSICVLTELFGLPLHSSHQNISVCFLVSVSLQLNTTHLPPILLVHPLLLLLSPFFAMFDNYFLFFDKLLAPYNLVLGILVCSCFFFFVWLVFFISTDHMTEKQYPKAVLTNPLKGWWQDDVLGQRICCFVFWQVSGDCSRPAVFPVSLSTVLVNIPQFLSLSPSTKK